MAAAPEGLRVEAHRDLALTRHRPWVRWILVAALAAVLVLGLLNLFGQHPTTASASAPQASLTLYAPTHIRSGLYFESRFTIFAHSELKNATLVLDPGWLEGTTMNSLEPSPVSEGSRNGRLTFELGRIPAGHTYVLFMQLQVNPTNVGSHAENVSLFDGPRKILTLDRTLIVFP
jgi:hypothetical protein